VRAVVLDPADRILLVRFTNPFTGESWWATTGGGIDEGESEEGALRRELREEAGLEPAELGPCVWTRESMYEWGPQLVRQVERYYLVRTPSADLSPGLSQEELAAENVHEVRWWALSELESTEETLAPRALPALLRSLLEEGPPPEPIDAGV